MFRLLTCLALCFLSTTLLAEEWDEAQRAKDERILQTVLRLPGFDLNAKPEAKAAVLRHLSRLEGEEKYFELVAKLNLAEDVAPALLAQAIAQPESNAGVNCAALLLKNNLIAGLQKGIAGEDEAAVPLLTALGLTGLPQALELVESVITENERSIAVRSAAVRGVGKLPGGEKRLLAIVEAENLATDLKFAAANVLLNSANAEIKTAAAKHLTLPATGDGKPLPTIPELVQRTGDAAAGRTLFFAEKSQCAKCHTVNGEGKDVGPNLSEIGTKLSKEALYLSILDPSAGVSFNYETSQIVTTEGVVVSGIVTSETAEAITIKTADAITRAIPKEEIEEIVKLKISLMPADLQRTLTAQELVDLVEFLTTLKKK